MHQVEKSGGFKRDLKWAKRWMKTHKDVMEDGKPYIVTIPRTIGVDEDGYPEYEDVEDDKTDSYKNYASTKGYAKEKRLAEKLLAVEKLNSKAEKAELEAKRLRNKAEHASLEAEMEQKKFEKASKNE